MEWLWFFFFFFLSAMYRLAKDMMEKRYKCIIIIRFILNHWLSYTCLFLLYLSQSNICWRIYRYINNMCMCAIAYSCYTYFKWGKLKIVLNNCYTIYWFKTLLKETNISVVTPYTNYHYKHVPVGIFFIIMISLKYKIKTGNQGCYFESVEWWNEMLKNM